MQGIRDKEMDNNYKIFELKRFVEWNNLKTKWSKSGSDNRDFNFQLTTTIFNDFLKKRHEILMIGPITQGTC